MIARQSLQFRKQRQICQRGMSTLKKKGCSLPKQQQQQHATLQEEYDGYSFYHIK